MCPGRRWARRVASAQLEVAIQHAFKEKYSYNIAVQGLSGVKLMMVGWTRAFAVANEAGRGGMSVRVAAAFVS